MTIKHSGPRTAGNKSLISYRSGLPPRTAHVLCLMIHGRQGMASWDIRATILHLSEFTANSRSERTEIKEANQTYSRDYLSNGGYSSLYASTVGLIKPLPNTSNETSDEFQGESVRSETADERANHSKPFLATSLYLNDYRVHEKPQRIGLLGAKALMGVKRNSAHGTTYSDSFELAAELKYGENWLEEKSLQPKTYVSEKPNWKDVDLKPRPMSSQYMTDFAKRSSEMIRRPGGDWVCSPPLMSDSSKTSAIKQAARSTSRGPPSSSVLFPTTVSRMDLKPDSKKFRLFTLQQYSLDVPGCVKFRPSTAYNLSRLQQTIAGTSLTSSPRYHLMLTTATSWSTKIAGDTSAPPKEEAPVRTSAMCQAVTEETAQKDMRSKGIIGFFQSGEVSQSSNGIHNAQGFYKLLRPYEGLPRMVRPSSRTESGYELHCYMIMLLTSPVCLMPTAIDSQRSEGRVALRSPAEVYSSSHAAVRCYQQVKSI
eukprot:750457-Hanusia_phi.AAC.5